jgi:hypothetical protein
MLLVVVAVQMAEQALLLQEEVAALVAEVNPQLLVLVYILEAHLFLVQDKDMMGVQQMLVVAAVLTMQEVLRQDLVAME